VRSVFVDNSTTPPRYRPAATAVQPWSRWNRRT